MQRISPIVFIGATFIALIAGALIVVNTFPPPISVSANQAVTE
jgi:hypothetical protein